jgi:hypothetical protein
LAHSRAYREEVTARSVLIMDVRQQRRARKPIPELRVRDIRVGPGPDTYVLTLSGERVHS